MTNPDGRDPTGPPDLASHLRDESPTASDALAPVRSTMQDLEKSLVERIADIDDERRRTSVQLRKALQTHMDQVETRLAGYRRLLALLSMLVLLFAAGLVWLGLGPGVQRARPAEQQVDGAGPSAPADDARAVDRLAARVAEIERALAQLAAEVGAGRTEPPPATLPETRVGGVDAVAERADAPAAGFAASAGGQQVRGSDTGASAANGSEPAGSDADSDGGVDVGGTEPAADAGTSAAETSESAPIATDQTPPGQAPEPAAMPQSLPPGAGDLQAEQQRLEAQIANARDQQDSIPDSDRLPIDQLIDDQLARLEREYQRLARQVDAPAVQPSSASTPPDNGVGGNDLMTLPAAPAAVAEPAPVGMQTSRASIAVQLIGFRSRDELRAFLANHQLPDPFYIRSETYRGEPWFALIHSLHDDLKGAADTVAALPKDLAELDIWLRELPAGTTLERVPSETGE